MRSRVPESQFQFSTTKKPRRSRKARKNYAVIELPPRKAKGRYPKGAGFNKSVRVERKPIMGDAVFDHGPLVDPHNDPYLKA